MLMRLREQLFTDVLGDHNTPLSVGYKTKAIFRELQTFFSSFILLCIIFFCFCGLFLPLTP